MAFEKFEKGRSSTVNSSVVFSVRLAYIAANLKFPKEHRLNIYFDRDTRRVAIEPTTEGTYKLNGNNGGFGCELFRREYNIPAKTRVKAAWNEDKTMIITEPVPEEQEEKG